jgi:hypothetical protein
MAEDWTARGSLGGLDIEILSGRGDTGEYLVLALKGVPDLERALASLAPQVPWLANPWEPWLEFWRAAWAPWLSFGLALAAPPKASPGGTAAGARP